MKQKVLEAYITGSFSSHFLLTSAEPEHAGELGGGRELKGKKIASTDA